MLGLHTLTLDKVTLDVCNRFTQFVVEKSSLRIDLWVDPLIK